MFKQKLRNALIVFAISILLFSCGTPNLNKLDNYFIDVTDGSITKE